MLGDISLALIISRRELRDQMRDWRILFPILFLALVFPFIMNFAAEQILNLLRSYGVGILAERIVPFLLMIVGFFPISVSLVVALESSVGEKERSTIEPLLNSPLKDGQLYLGKLISSASLPMLGGYLGMLVYLAACHARGIALPELELTAQIFALTGVQAVMMVAAAVVVSTQATTVRSANLLASFIIIPVALLVQGESMVMFWGNHSTLWWVVLGVAVLTLLLARMGLAHFRREELLSREVDSFNLISLGRVFVRQFKGNATSAWDWYLHEVPVTLRGLGLPALLVTLLACASVVIGADLVRSLDAPALERTLVSESQRVALLNETYPLFDYHLVLAIWWQNTRAMLLAMLLGGFSFGILGTMPIIMTLVLAGYVSALVVNSGIPLEAYVIGFILPHGVIEIPTAILATAVVLRAGAAMAAPSTGRTVSEQFMVSLADFARIMLGLIIPLLFIAAALEAWLTPRIALMMLGG